MQRTDILYETTGFDGGAVWNADIKPYGDHDRGNGNNAYEEDLSFKVAFFRVFDEWYYVKKYQSTWWKYVDKLDGEPIRARIGRRYLYSY